MITKIDNIKNFGIYKNFNWGNMVEFKEKNIIYGWNYSGKTTLSRVFSTLRDKELFTSYSGADFKITTNNGVFTKANLIDFPFTILVFNSDYVQENLKWEKDDDINAIFFEVGEDAKRSKRIDELNTEIININGDDKTKGIKEKFVTELEDFNAFENTLFTNESRRIKNDIFSSLIEFNKGNFKKQRDLVVQNINGFILKKSEIDKLSKVVKIKEPKPELEIIEYQLSLNKIIDNVNELLVREPKKEDIISVLESNQDILEWTKKGLELNKADTNCLFCDNPVTSDRIKLLNKFYANEGSKLRQESKPLFELVNLHKENLDKINFPASIQDINEGFQQQYSKQKNIVDKKLIKYQKKLDEVLKQLSEKVNNNVYQKADKIISFDIGSCEEELLKLNSIIKSNNEFSSNFQALIKSERLKYINHLVAKFLKDNKYKIKENKFKKAILEIEKLDKKVALHTKEIERLNALKDSGKEGCQQFNSFIQSFLGKEDIDIKYNEEKKKFNLFRGEQIAKHLSEGEKMAISFSHFFVTLKSIEDKKKLNDTIVFIDDPISSLDGNHIFQINAMLKDFFYTQGIEEDKPEKWGQKCKQLFVSTHNFEFFNLLKELPTQNGFRYSKKGTNGNESRYFVARKINESQLEKLPVVYDTYNSEYHFLFKEIFAFNSDPDSSSSDKLLLMPNILRRFLEMYTLTKYPSTDNVDKRANEIFGDVKSKRICKPFHHFSHFDNIDRIGKQSEFLADISASCKELIKYIQDKDKKHFKALKSVL